MLNVLESLTQPHRSICNESMGSHRNCSIVISWVLIGMMTCMDDDSRPPNWSEPYWDGLCWLGYAIALSSRNVVSPTSWSLQVIGKNWQIPPLTDFLLLLLLLWFWPFRVEVNTHITLYWVLGHKNDIKCEGPAYSQLVQHSTYWQYSNP